MTRFVSVAVQLIIAGFFTYLISCSPEACFEETNAFLKASFYLDATGNYKAPDSLLCTAWAWIPINCTIKPGLFNQPCFL